MPSLKAARAIALESATSSSLAEEEPSPSSSLLSEHVGARFPTLAASELLAQIALEPVYFVVAAK